MSEQYANAPTTTLNGAITAGATSLVVTSASGFPSSGNFRIIVDSEIMLVTAVSGTTFTVTRGSESTTASSHLNLATVGHILTAGALDQIRADMVRTDVYANIPAANAVKAGTLFLPTDGSHLFRSDGSAWSAWGPLSLMYPSTTGTWTWFNQSSATLTANGSALTIESAANANTDGFHIVYKTLPSVPYTIDLVVDIEVGSAALTEAFAGWFLVSNSHIQGMQFRNDSGSFTWSSDNFNNGTTYAGTSAFGTLTINYLRSTPLFVRLKDDNTNRTISLSADGLSFRQIFTVSRTNFLTPDSFAWGVNPQRDAAGISLLSYHEH